MRKLLFLIIIMLLSMNSLLLAKKNPAKLLQQNIQSWEQFRWQGIIQVQSSAFAIRKYFVLARNQEAARLDILDSGIMGLAAKPLVSVYVKDKIVLSAPSIKQLEGIDPNWFIPQNSIDQFVHFSDSLLARQSEIITNRKIKSGESVYYYDKKYRLSQIQSPKLGIEANVTYNRRNQPTKISIKYGGEPLVEIQITDRTYKNIEIEPLTPVSKANDIETTIPDNTEDTE